MSNPRNPTTSSLTYQFTDLPLYRSLLLLTSSPSSITVTPLTHLGRKGGVWLIAFDLFERIWNLCRGVCDYAIGRGQGGQSGGELRLGEHEDEDDYESVARGEEDARPLLGFDGYDQSDNTSERGFGLEREDVDGHDEDELEGDESIRKGRLILKQLHHNSYHLYLQLRKVVKPGSEVLGETELKRLCQRSGSGPVRWLSWGGNVGETLDGRFWSHLAVQWGMVLGLEEDF
jgi:hypothetical protein